MKRFITLTLALLFAALPALGAGTWSPSSGAIGAGRQASFQFGGSDAGNAQPALEVVPGYVWITSNIGASTVSVSFFACDAPSNDPAADAGCSLLATVTADARSPQRIAIGAGQIIDVDIDTDGDGGTIYFVATGVARTDISSPVDGRVGTIWLQDSQDEALAWLVGRNAPEVITGDLTSTGFEGCFIDFTRIADFSIGKAGAFTGAVTSIRNHGLPALVGLTGTATYDPASLADGAGETTTITVTGAALGDWVEAVSFTRDLAGITLTGWVSAANTVSVRLQNESGGVLDLLSGTLAATVRSDDTLADATSLTQATWARFPIGSPATTSFYSNRFSGALNQRLSEAFLGVDTVNSGNLIVAPLCGVGNASSKLVSAAWRVRDVSTSKCFWVGFINSLVGSDVPFTTTCTLASSATSKWVGVFTRSGTMDLRVGMQQANSFTLDYDSGYDMPASSTDYTTIEMRAYLSGHPWATGWVDFYVNGKLLAQAGRVHSIEPADMTTAWNTQFDPLSLGAAMVSLSGVQAIELEYIGLRHTRSAEGYTLP